MASVFWPLQPERHCNLLYLQFWSVVLNLESYDTLAVLECSKGGGTALVNIEWKGSRVTWLWGPQRTLKKKNNEVWRKIFFGKYGGKKSCDYFSGPVRTPSWNSDNPRPWAMSLMSMIRAGIYELMYANMWAYIMKPQDPRFRDGEAWKSPFLHKKEIHWNLAQDPVDRLYRIFCHYKTIEKVKSISRKGLVSWRLGCISRRVTGRRVPWGGKKVRNISTGYR